MKLVWPSWDLRNSNYNDHTSCVFHSIWVVLPWFNHVDSIYQLPTWLDYWLIAWHTSLRKILESLHLNMQQSELFALWFIIGMVITPHPYSLFMLVSLVACLWSRLSSYVFYFWKQVSWLR
jgi:hypothetical protein